MQQPSILFREDADNRDEYLIAQKYQKLTVSRSNVPPDSLVIGRYSVLPYYKELDRDLGMNGSRLINSYSEHCWIADLQQWYPYFEDITPKTWFSLQEAMKQQGPFVVKGETNSKKFEWLTHMYAADTTALIDVYRRCSEDSLVGSQSIYVRQYVPLKQLAMGLRGLPISNEHRTFFLDGKPIASGFYWSSHVDELASSPVPPPASFLEEIGSRLKARFVVADVAETAAGDWILIEINEGQMSGLSEIDADQLYSALAAEFKA